MQFMFTSSVYSNLKNIVKHDDKERTGLCLLVCLIKKHILMKSSKIYLNRIQLAT